MADQIAPHARLIAALAETMDDRTWADEVFTRCKQIEDALKVIREIARQRRSGER